MRLTARQREILEGLRDDSSGLDLVEEGLEAWFGDERTSVRTIIFFLRHCLISLESNEGCRCRYYRINEWGCRALDDPSFEPDIELAKLIAAAEKAAQKLERG